MANVGYPSYLYPHLVATPTGAQGEFPITPHDTNNLPRRPRAIRVNGAGVLKYFYPGEDDAGTPHTATVTAGEVLDIHPARILATDTTATGIVGYD